VLKSAKSGNPAKHFAVARFVGISQKLLDAEPAGARAKIWYIPDFDWELITRRDLVKCSISR